MEFVVVLDRWSIFFGWQIFIVRYDVFVCIIGEIFIQIQNDCFVILFKSGLVWRVYEMVLQSVCSLVVFFFKFYILCISVVSGVVFLVKVYEGDIFDDKFRELWQFYIGSCVECIVFYFQF